MTKKEMYRTSISVSLRTKQMFEENKKAIELSLFRKGITKPLNNSEALSYMIAETHKKTFPAYIYKSKKTIK